MKCPNCNNEVSEGWAICPFCKYEPRKCSNPDCNSGWLPSDAVYCPLCGKQLDKNGTLVTGGKRNKYKEDRDIRRVIINNVQTENNVYESGMWGMKIHVKFEAYAVYGHDIQVAAYFYYATSQPIKDLNGKYSTSDGHVATHVNIVPNATNCRYKDLILFIPYKELHLSRECACYYEINIWDGDEMMASSRVFDFYYDGHRTS